MAAPTTAPAVNVPAYTFTATQKDNTPQTTTANCRTNCGRSWSCGEVGSKIGFALAVLAAVGVALSVVHMTGTASLNLGSSVSATTLNSAMFYTLIGSAGYLGLYGLFQTVSHCQKTPERTISVSPDQIDHEAKTRLVAQGYTVELKDR